MLNFLNRENIRKRIYGFFQLKGSSRSIALGAALGVWVAFSPTYGFQLLLTALICTLVGANRLAGLAGVWITNPVTFVPIYGMAFKTGQLIIAFFVGSMTRTPFIDVFSAEGLYRADILNPALLENAINLAHLKGLGFWESVKYLAQLGRYALAALLLGCFTHSMIWSVLSYFGTLFLLSNFRKIRLKNRLGQRHDRIGQRPGGAAV